MNAHRYFATCARGLEPILADELTQLAANEVAIGRGGVAFSGDAVLLYRANLWLRTAIRVLQPILETPVDSFDSLYEAVRTVDWSELMTPDHTLAVDCNLRDSTMTHSLYASRRVKDAICDQFRERVGRRPSVDTETPMIGLNLHVYRNQATLSLDSSGESLHKRGYRPALTIAPLNEALAAALILRSGWHGDAPFADPMCGSGAIPIEAAWIAANRPPGLTRKRFGFQGWMSFDVALWASIRDEARRGVKKQLPHGIFGFDLRRDVVDFAHHNAKSAGVGHWLRFATGDIRSIQPAPGPVGTLICNPPYGERIGEEKDLIPLYRGIGQAFRERWAGWSTWVFTGNSRLADEIRLKRLEEIPLFNGKIPCKFIHFASE